VAAYENELAKYIGRVGSGPHSSKDLSYDEAFRSMEAVLAGRYHPVTLGGFLQSMRFKGETPDELAGFLDAVRARDLVPLGAEIPGLLDVAGNYDGKRKTPVISLAASLIAAGAGVTILLHGGTDIPTKRGVVEAHLLPYLGVDPDGDHEAAAAALECSGIAYLHHRRFTPAAHRLLEARQALGKRSFINAIEPHVNPANARAHVGSFFHIAYGERLCEAIARSTAGFDRAVIVQGIEGAAELRPGRAHVAELRGTSIETYTVKSEELGLPGSLEELEALGADAASSAELTMGLLQGRQAPSAFASAALLSAALRIYASGKVSDLAAGVAAARKSLESGAAREVLEAWRKAAPAAFPAGAPASVSVAANASAAVGAGEIGAASAANGASGRQDGYAARTGWKGPMTTFPVFLVGLDRRTCVVVGGGRIAAEKVRSLLAGGAGRIVVVSPELGEELQALARDPRVAHVARQFEEADVDGAFIVMAATDDPAVNQRAFAAAEARGILAQVVDDPVRCAFIMPSIVRRGDLTIAISTGGASPALAVRLKERLSEMLGVEYERFVALAGELRPLIMDRIEDAEVRKRLWYEIVDSDVLSLLKAGDAGKARTRALELIERAARTLEPAAAAGATFE